ncbi:MAG TPA: methylated-DNA--[protein]-cysteine S-methyltransferase [Solirubrobacteraceae bacterium]|nr:methylated-DNA--[protein]-cysteine S-methyltransferase [Solirubrobacteraceae bacterium]
MSRRNGVSGAELERALRRGPGHARDVGESGPREGPDAVAEAAHTAARRLSDRLAEQGLADVSYAPVDSPFGKLLLAASASGLVRLAFPEESEELVLERLAARISPRIVQAPARLDPIRRELDEYFAGRRRVFELPLDWSLAGPFARRVLGATAQIPYGRVLSYAEVAAEAGSPRGSRAAGNALGANPIPIVVPCHRVLRSGGSLGGYAGGLERKQFLLELEGALGDR